VLAFFASTVAALSSAEHLFHGAPLTSSCATWVSHALYHGVRTAPMLSLDKVVKDGRGLLRVVVC
jgi:hypothetical protein